MARNCTILDLTGTSCSTIEDAIQNALKQTTASLRKLRWFELVEVCGDVDPRSSAHWQVRLKAGFQGEEEREPVPSIDQSLRGMNVLEAAGAR